MLSLLDLQHDFRTAVLGGDADALAALVEGDGLAPQARLAVHRNNVAASLTAVLADTFPVIRRLVDERFFAFAADAFIRAAPPARPCLAEYGATFPDFIAAFPPCRDFPYLPDVARLEWRLHEAAQAPQRVALAPAVLQTFAADDTARLVFAMQPALGYLESRYPVDSIWRANQACTADGASVDLDAGPVFLEIARVDGDVALRALPPAAHAFRAGLKYGATLENAADAALARDAAFDLTQALSQLFAEGVITGARVAEAAS
jgi:hypothetical protein